MLTKAGVCV